MSQNSKPYVSIARKYAEGVVSGKVIACEWVKKACQRQIDDLARAKKGGWQFVFDPKKATAVCSFVELMPHIKGSKWAGQKISLEPWQCFILTTIFGWVHKETKLRRFRLVYLEMGRKNAKSTMSAPIGVYLMCADGEAGQEVYSAATTRDQAKIVWEVAKQMVEREPGLRAALGVDTSAHSIYQTSSASKFIAVSAEGNSLDGLNGSSIIDELHAHRTRKVYDVLETAKAARSQPLLWCITTAGFDRSGICYEVRSYLTKILSRTTDDDSLFGIIYTADEGDDYFSEDTWKKANPNYGISVDPDELRRLATKAQKMPSALNNFLTKHLSVWVNADVALFDIAQWEKLNDAGSEDDHTEPCWLSVDLAPRHDFTSRVKLFREERDGLEHYFAYARHFLSEGEIEESENASFAGWADEGWITTNPGNVTDYAAVEEAIREDSQKHEVKEVLYDPFSAHQFATRMQEEGFPMVEVRATVQNFSEATKFLDALISEGRIHHNGDPILTWMLSNVVGHYDRKDNVYPVKEFPQNKIDGAVALIMALSRAMVGSGDTINFTPRTLDIGPLFGARA